MYRWIRDLHLYAGLFVSPFVLLFAVSVWFLNHGTVDVTAWTSIERGVPIQVPPGVETAEGPAAVALAREILPQLSLDGEVGFTRFVRSTGHFLFPVSRPGLDASVDVDTTAGTATVSSRATGLLETIGGLHKMPGPHNVNIRGNWWGTRLWTWFADATIYLMLFLSVTGLYLWVALRVDRLTGLVLLGAGAASLAGLMYAIAR